MKLLKQILPILTLSAFMLGCEDKKMTLDCEKVVLGNGLSVLLCQGSKAPVVTVGVLYHVGANREEKGKTGFAHLFEHLMFSESQHVPPKLFWGLIQGLGGSMNGWTSVDHTFYYETVPSSGLEIALWLEADRMGYLLPTMTPKALAVQQGVVINEKRQTEENVPYGYDFYIKTKTYYSKEHPCNHTVIGETQDLVEAKLTDVRAFHEKYYVPKNATLVICGNFDRAEALKLVEKYFGELPGGEALPDPKPSPVKLEKTLNYSYIDKLATSPDFSWTFPGVAIFDEEAPAMKALAELMAGGKGTPLYKAVVDEKLSTSVSAYSDGCDIAGDFTITAKPLPGVKVDALYKAMQKGLEEFEKNFNTYQDELDRYKSKCLREFYVRLQKTKDRAFLAAYADEYAGSYNYLNEIVEQIDSLTLEKIWSVYEKYIKGKNSFLYTALPADDVALAMEGTTFWPEIKEPTVDESHFGQPGEGYEAVADLPSSFDRTKIPAEGKLPRLQAPIVTDEKPNKNVRLLIEKDASQPLAEVSVIIHAGEQFETMENSGIAKLTMDLLQEGTQKKTATEFDAAIRNLGADFSVEATSDSVMLRLQVLKKNLVPALALIEEALLYPAFREEDFLRIKNRQLEQLRQDNADPSQLADNLLLQEIYGNIPLAQPTYGTEESLEKLTRADVKKFYESVFRKARLSITGEGEVDENILKTSLAETIAAYGASEILKEPPKPTPLPVSGNVITRVKIKDAAQSEIRFGFAAPNCDNPESFKARIMNFALGGSFNSRLNILLREEKAYTYGAGSFFSTSKYNGFFLLYTAVDARYTNESLELIKGVLEKYPEELSQKDLDDAKSTMSKSLLCTGETITSRSRFLESVCRYDFPVDYLVQREKIIEEITLPEIKELAKKYIDYNRMKGVVVGPEGE